MLCGVFYLLCYSSGRARGVLSVVCVRGAGRVAQALRCFGSTVQSTGLHSRRGGGWLYYCSGGSFVMLGERGVCEAARSVTAG